MSTDVVKTVSHHSFKVGDWVVFKDFPRTRAQIWKDRLRRLRWNVPLTETVTRYVTSTVTSGDQE